MKEFSIYIHIPFCVSKCKYCDFNSYDNKDEYIEKYVNSLIDEINSFKIDNNEYICKTIYIGGGTPSYIDSKYIVDILLNIKKKFNIYKDSEITIEVNPCSVTKEKLLDYYNCGINRISMGLQTTNNELLQIIGRKHNYEMFVQKYNLIRKIGFNNINVDLMLGLPNQTIEDITNSIKSLINLNPNHISCYSLILYEQTKLYEEVKNKKYTLPDDDLERNMYYRVIELLKEAGYIQYEISNFSKIGYESRHNMMCWKQYEYVGFGVGAHSFMNNIRYCNIDDIERYIINIKHNKINENIVINETMKKDDLMKEYMILGFRLIKGINTIEFRKKFGINIIDIFENEINNLVKQNYIELKDDCYVLTQKGLDYNNIACEEFI